MPGFNQKGPMGQGSMTGRALGFCNGNEMPCSASRTGRGNNRSMGIRLGFGHCFSQGRSFRKNSENFFHRYRNSSQYSKENVISSLKMQVEELNKTKEAIEKRLAELEETVI